MKVEWVEIEGTKLLELNYNFTKSQRIPIPSDIAGAIVKVNFLLASGGYKANIVDKVISKLKARKPALVFVGNIRVQSVEKETRKDKALPLSLTRPELVSSFVKKFAPKKLRKRILKEANRIMSKAE